MSRLSGIALLESLSPEELLDIEKLCRWQRYRKGEQIVERASENRDVFFVVEGTVEIVNHSLSGRAVAYADLGAGQFFGELSAIDNEPRSASVIARTDCLVASIPPAEFIALLGRHPQVTLCVMRRLASIVRICDERIMDLATLGAMQRVIVELMKLARPDPAVHGRWLVYPAPPQRETAVKAATTRETVARVFTQLQETGLIFRKDKTLYIRDREGLERLAQRLDPDAGKALKNA